jgi:chromosome partitioning protein
MYKKGDNMAKIISVNIQKGGCAKTTTSINLGSCLNTKGNKVLLIDSDPQSNLSYACGVESSEKTLYEVLRGNCKIDEAIVSLEEFDIIPSNILLSGAEQEFTKTGREYILKDALEPVLNVYDYIIIDTPPSLGILTVNSLTCANYTLIPTEASFFSLQGLGQLYQNIETVRKYCNKDLQILGLLLVKYSDRTNLNKTVSEMVEDAAKEMNTKIFNTKISESVKVKEAQGMQVTLKSYAPDCKPFINYMELTEEILSEVK